MNISSTAKIMTTIHVSNWTGNLLINASLNATPFPAELSRTNFSVTHPYNYSDDDVSSLEVDGTISNLTEQVDVGGGAYENGGVNLTFTNFNDEPYEYIFDRKDVRVIFLILYTIVFCSCFFGNLLVILVVTLHWRMRSITNFCLANLAFADLCVGIFCVYQNIVTYLMESWIFGEFMCKMYHFINSLSTTASVLILVVICIERYLAIIHPMTCKQILTLPRLRIAIFLVWILSALISSPRFYYFSTLSMPLPNQQTEILCLPNRLKYDSKMMDMITMIMLFLIPLAIITVLYTHIGIVLWRSSNDSVSAGGTTTPTPMNSSSSEEDYGHSNESHSINPANLNQLLSPSVHPLESLKVSRSHHETSASRRLSFSLCFNCRNKSDNRRNKLPKGEKKKLHCLWLRSPACQRNPSEIRPGHGELPHHLSSVSGCVQNLDQACGQNLDVEACCTSSLEKPCDCRCHHNCYSIKTSAAAPKPKAAAPRHKRVQRLRVVRNYKYGAEALRSRRRVIRMLIVVVLTFAVGHLPFHARKIWQYWSPKWAPYEAGGVFSTLFTPITFLIMYANSGINPILYAFMSKKFRTSFKDMLCCRIRHSFRINVTLNRQTSIKSAHVATMRQTGL